MKKRMLITTIVMVLVVAIALTTSSLAWFTMSASVSISEVSFGAVTYDGAQLSVAGLARTGWGASASIGTGIDFDPTQGKPELADFTWGTSANWALISLAGDTFQEAVNVTTTAAGNQTANQKVTLADSGNAYFLGGFNVRNDGTGNATVKINATLNVGTAGYVDPGTATNTADDYYVYGDFTATAGITPGAVVNGVQTYTTSLSRVETEAAFAENSSDLALAGGLRVAMFTRDWVYTLAAGEDPASYVNSETPVAEGIWGFTNYKVTWGVDNWVCVREASSTNALYVMDPGAGIYSMNPVLADEDCYVDASTVYDANTNPDGICALSGVVARGDDTLPEKTYTILGTDDETITTAKRDGLEVVVVVWMDGWDQESVPAAGGGRVSLAYSVTSSTAD